MLKIISSACLSFGEFKKPCITKLDEQTNAHLFSHKTRSLQANQTYKGFLASALANMGRSRDASIKPLHFGLHRGFGGKKQNAKSACQSLQRWLTLLWRLCSWCTDTLKQGTEYCPQDGEWPAWLLYRYELHTAVILSPTGNHWTLQTVSLRDVETKSGIIYFVKTSY